MEHPVGEGDVVTELDHQSASQKSTTAPSDTHSKVPSPGRHGSKAAQTTAANKGDADTAAAAGASGGPSNNAGIDADDDDVVAEADGFMSLAGTLSPPPEPPTVEVAPGIVTDPAAPAPQPEKPPLVSGTHRNSVHDNPLNRRLAKTTGGDFRKGVRARICHFPNLFTLLNLNNTAAGQLNCLRRVMRAVVGGRATCSSCCCHGISHRAHRGPYPFLPAHAADTRMHDTRTMNEHWN
jgi:hypothetical protein